MERKARQPLRIAFRGWRLPMLASGVIFLSQAFHLISPVRDAVTEKAAAGYHLIFPFWHLVFTPFCTVADAMTILSVHQLYVVIAYIVAGAILIGWRRGAALLLFFLAFAAWGALVPRPMGRLVADDPNILLVDFHSHSQYSHDGRKSFTPQANMHWHEEQGYDAAFITDHNRVEAAQIAKTMSRDQWKTTHYRSLSGEEISLQKTHLVILGNAERVDNHPYDGDFARVGVFIRDMHKQGFPVIASLPEYWLYHWGEGIEKEVHWGMDGFEIVNSAPKALDFPAAYKLKIIDLCRHQNLFMTGISDNHGYGYATAVWNAVQLPGWHALGPDSLEHAILFKLKTGGFTAVQVLEREKFFADGFLQLCLTPFGMIAVLWRSLQPSQAASWVFWIWGLYFLYPLPRTQRSGLER